jgi:hypothetical protein
MTTTNFKRIGTLLGSALLVALTAVALASTANAGAKDRTLTQTFSMDDLGISTTSR